MMMPACDYPLAPPLFATFHSLALGNLRRTGVYFEISK